MTTPPRLEAPSTKWGASAAVGAVVSVLVAVGPDVVDAAGIDWFGDGPVPWWGTVIGIGMMLAAHYQTRNRRLSTHEVGLARDRLGPEVAEARFEDLAEIDRLRAWVDELTARPDPDRNPAEGP